MRVSPDMARVLYSYVPGPDSEVAMLADAGGTDVQYQSNMANGQGYMELKGFEWGPEGRQVLYPYGGRLRVDSFRSDNTLERVVAEISPGDLSYDGEPLLQFRGWNWGDDSDHIVVAATTETATFPEPSKAHVYLIDLASGGVAERLTERPLVGTGFSIAKGGGAAVVLGRAGTSMDLVTNAGQIALPLSVPDGYPERRGLPAVSWGEDSRSFTIQSSLEGPRPDTDQSFTLGIIDSQDPDLLWREFGDLIPESETWIDSVFRL